MRSDEDEVSEDQIFDILSSARRRYLIYYLRQRDGEVSVNELADQVAMWEYEVDEEELTDQQQKRIYVSLYQTHLPKLAELGVVEYDKDEGVVSLTDRSRMLDTHLDGEEQRDPPWYYLYLALGVGGLLLLTASFLDAPVLGAVDASLLGIVFAFLFAAVAVVQIGYERYGGETTVQELER